MIKDKVEVNRKIHFTKVIKAKRIENEKSTKKSEYRTILCKTKNEKYQRTILYISKTEREKRTSQQTRATETKI